MARFLLEVLRFPSDRQLTAMAYYVVLDQCPQSTKAKTDGEAAAQSSHLRQYSSIDNRTAVAQQTVEAAVQEVQRKVAPCFEAQDTIEYGGIEHASRKGLLDAVNRARSHWQ